MTLHSAVLETTPTIPTSSAAPFDDVGEASLAPSGNANPFELESGHCSPSVTSTVSGGVYGGEE